MGPLVVGGFSQGGAMAQETFNSPLHRIVVLLLRYTVGSAYGIAAAPGQLVRRRCSGCMAYEMASLTRTVGLLLTVRRAGWSVELVEHQKGHMIPTEHRDVLKDWLDDIVN